MSTVKKIEGYVSKPFPEPFCGEGETQRNFFNTDHHLCEPAPLFIGSEGVIPKVYTQEQLDAAVRLTLQRVQNMNEAGRAIAKIIAEEHGIQL